MAFAKYRRDLLDIYLCAKEAVGPERIIKKSVVFEDNSLVVSSQNLEPIRVPDLNNKRIHVIGGGKSVLGMALGLAEMVEHSKTGSLFTHGHLSIPSGLRPSFSRDVETSLSKISTQVSFTSKNNLPDEDSVSASKTILDKISQACQEDQRDNLESLFFILLSGGGSACLTSPRYISLENKLSIIKHLVERGATIIELNQVRRYFSNLKAGRLARTISSLSPQARIIALILSDVVGDPIEFIASGPTHLGLPEETEREEELMLNILRRYCFDVASLPEIVTQKEVGSLILKPCRVSNCIVGNNTLALSEAHSRAKDLGYEVKYIGNDLQGTTEEIVDRLVETGLDHKPTERNLLVLAGGEAIVRKLSNEGWGRGGRLQEMAVDYIIKISEIRGSTGLDNYSDMLLAGSSDGQDGPTDVGACLVSHMELISSTKWSSELVEAARKSKSSHDTYNFWNDWLPGCLIKNGLTGTNVMDLYMYMLWPRQLGGLSEK